MTLSSVAATPDPVFFEITDCCNLHCRHCYAAARTSGRSDLPLHLLDRLFAELRSMGTFGVVLSGGEPLMHPSFEEVVGRAADSDLLVGVTTNGTLWTRGLVRRVRGLISNIQVSIDSSSPTKHDEFRDFPGAHRLASETVAEAAEAGLFVTVAMVLFNWNRSEIEHNLRAAYDRGASRFKVLRPIPVGRARALRDSIIPLSSYADVEAELRYLTEEYAGRIEVDWDRDHAAQDGAECIAGRKVLVVRSEGSVVPCPFLSDQDHVVGSVAEDCLADIWTSSPELRAFRKLLRQIDPRCQACPHVSRCGGGCYAMRATGIWPLSALCGTGTAREDVTINGA